MYPLKNNIMSYFLFKYLEIPIDFVASHDSIRTHKPLNRLANTI